MQIFTYKRVNDLAEALRNYDTSENGSGTETVFVVPTRPDMERLKDIFLEGQGLGLSIPCIWRWSDLFREIRMSIPSSNHRRQIDPPDHWLIVRYILDSILEDGLFPSLPGLVQKGFAFRLGNSLRELMREEIEPGSLCRALSCSGCTGTGACLHENEPEGILCRTYHMYHKYLEENSICDSAQIATLTRELIENFPQGKEWARNRKFVFTGFLSFNHSQLNLVRCLCENAADVEIYTPVTGIKEAYTVLSQFEESSVRSLGNETPLDIIRIRGGDRRLEIETVCRELILWSHSEGNITEYRNMPFPGWGSISMSCPENYINLVEEVVERYGIPYSIREGLTVSETPLWELAKRAWDCAQDDWPSHKTSRLLQEPPFLGERFPVEEFEKDLPSGESGWYGFLSSFSNGMEKAFEGLVTFCSSLRKGGTANEILKAFFDLFDGSGTERGTSRYVMDIPELDENCRRMNAALRETEEKLSSIRELVKDIGPAGKNAMKGNRAFEFLRRWADTSTIWNSPSTANAMEIYPGTPPVLSSNRVWVFTGINSGNWPGTLRETPLLPDSRKELLHSGIDLGKGHLPLIPELRRQREYLFRRIIACGEDLCILSDPEADDSGRPLTPSPFLARIMEESTAPWALDLTGGSGAITRGLENILPLENEVIIDPVEVREKQTWHIPGDPRKLPFRRVSGDNITPVVSLSSLDDWIACPFMYHCRHILGLEVPQTGYDSRKAGICLHRLWEKSWRSYLESGGSLTGISMSLLEETIKEYYSELCSDPSLGRYLARFRGLVRNGGEIQYRMEETGLRSKKLPPIMEGWLPELEINGVRFKGRFDRLDPLGNEKGVLIDYKSGKSTAYRKSMQLAAYCVALAKGDPQGNIFSGKVSGYAYLCSSDGKVTGSALDSDTADYTGFSSRYLDLEEKMEKAEEHMASMAESIMEGNFPPNYDSSYCSYCSFSGICRRQEKPEGEDLNDNNQ